MSMRRAAASAGSAEFTQPQRSASKLARSKNTTTSLRKDLQSPKRRPCSRYAGLNNGDSPGEGEASQDIVWDSTSPTQASGGTRSRNNRVVEISDIVNRIAPKDVKRVGSESPLLQWIGDSAVPCTPEVSKPRQKKKSVRHNSVDDLLKLARQFDENMQQDQETSKQQEQETSKLQDVLSSNASEHVNSEATVANPGEPSSTKVPKCPPSSAERVEAELHALFDSSTQAISGRLSPGTQDSKGPTKSNSTALTPRESQSSYTCDDFDDDWETDDLLNDSVVLALTNGTLLATAPDLNTKTNTAASTSKPTANTRATGGVQPSCGALQDLCPQGRTTNRSTFKLEPNPHFQAKTVGNKNGPPSKSTVTHSSRLHKPDQSSNANTSTSTTLSAPPSASQQGPCSRAAKSGVTATDCILDSSDCAWADGVDDELLYEMCDTIERISNSQAQQPGVPEQAEKHSTAADKQRKSTSPLPIQAGRSVNTGPSSNRQPSCGLLRFNSLPSSGRDAASYQGWNVPMKGGGRELRLAQSLPGERVGLGSFNQTPSSSGTFQVFNSNADTLPGTVTGVPEDNSTSSHPTFKRNLSDSGTSGNKVFVTSQMTGKCSAAEIERKKQEALARRRLRMQNAAKP